MSIHALSEDQRKELARCAGILGTELGTGNAMELLRQKFDPGLSILDNETGEFRNDRATVFAEGQRSVILWIDDMIKVAREL